MRSWTVSVLTAAMIAAMTGPAAAASARLEYKMAPGQIWITTLSTQSETTFMGQKDVTRSKSVIEYRVGKGAKKGWVSLTARIRPQKPEGEQAAAQMDLSKITFMADLHGSGEIRNARHEGNPMTVDTEGMNDQMKAMVAQSSKMMADAWQGAVFWFPELPEESLQPGDEFETVRKLGMGAGGMESETTAKQVFTLEEISRGLAYFSVREKSVTRTKGVAGGKADTKTAGKGETVFDLQSGMWTDLTAKSKSKVNLSNLPGMSAMSQEVLTVTKFEMERKK